MKLLEIKVTLPPTKPRNPNQEVLAAKRNAAGPMKKPREGVHRDEKYKKPVETSEAVAAPFEKFSKDDKVKVKKTGEEVTVVSQNDIGLVFTKADDAKAHFFKGGHAQSKGYKEYMPRELERVSESLANGELEKKILRELENIFLSKVDSDGRRGWNEYNKETQLDYVMSYGSGREVLKQLERRGYDSLDDIAKFFKQPAHEQFKQLLPYFERIEF